MNRRGFLAGVFAAAAAPAYVRSESLMKLWVPKPVEGGGRIMLFNGDGILLARTYGQDLVLGSGDRASWDTFFHADGRVTGSEVSIFRA